MSMNKFLSKFSALTSDNIVQFIGGTVEMCKYWEKLRKMMKCYKMKTKHKYFCAIEIGFCLHSIPIKNVVANEKTKQTGSISRIGRRKMILMFWLFQIYFKEINAFCFRYRYGIVIMYTVYWTQIVHLLYLAVNFRIVWEEKKKNHIYTFWNQMKLLYFGNIQTLMRVIIELLH